MGVWGPRRCNVCAGCSEPRFGESKTLLGGVRTLTLVRKGTKEKGIEWYPETINIHYVTTSFNYPHRRTGRLSWTVAPHYTKSPLWQLRTLHSDFFSLLFAAACSLPTSHHQQQGSIYFTPSVPADIYRCIHKGHTSNYYLDWTGLESFAWILLLVLWISRKL